MFAVVERHDGVSGLSRRPVRRGLGERPKSRLRKIAKTVRKGNAFVLSRGTLRSGLNRALFPFYERRPVISRTRRIDKQTERREPFSADVSSFLTFRLLGPDPTRFFRVPVDADPALVDTAETRNGTVFNFLILLLV